MVMKKLQLAQKIKMKICYLSDFTLIFSLSHSFSLPHTNKISQKWKLNQTSMYKSSFNNKHCLCLVWSHFAYFPLHCPFNHQNLIQTYFKIIMIQQSFSTGMNCLSSNILLSIQSSSIANSRIYAYYNKVNKLVFIAGLLYSFSYPI